MTPRRPTLSACLIVRDEEAMLPGCLQSLTDLADEIVVLDTGSTDRTVELARAHGARVERFTWIDDFAAARNAALAAIRGEWVLVIDADERLAPGAADAIRAVIAAPAPPRTLWLPLIESVDATGAVLGADHMPRLWRHDPALRFAGRVHEQLVADGPLRHVVADAIRLIHLGYDPAITTARAKRARNRALLLAEQAERPADLGVAYHLAKEDYAAGDDAAALAGFERVIAGGPPNLALSSALFAVECLRHLDRAADAVARARRWLAAPPPHAAAPPPDAPALDAPLAPPAEAPALDAPLAPPAEAPAPDAPPAPPPDALVPDAPLAPLANAPAPHAPPPPDRRPTTAPLAGAADYGELWFAAARAAYEAGDPETAAALLTGAHRAPRGLAAAAFRDPTVAAWQADLLHARIARARGQLDDAAAAFAAVRPRLPAAARAAADLDAAEVALARGEPDAAFALVEPLIDAAPADAAEVLLALVQALVDAAGITPARQLLAGLFTAHPALLHQLPLVGAAAELAEAAGDEAEHLAWLRLCVRLRTPHPEHHRALAALDAAGRTAEAAPEPAP